MTLAEPTTVLTDVLLAGVGAGLAWRLDRAGRDPARPGVRLWGGAFLAGALAAGLGAVRHGLGARLAAGPERALWLGTVWGIGAAGFLMLAGTARACAGPRARRALVAAGAAKLLALVAWTAGARGYLPVLLDAAVSTAGVAALMVGAARRGRFDGLPHAAAGFALGLGGALLREAGVAPHPGFNENDLYHVVQLASLWLIQRAALRLPG